LLPGTNISFTVVAMTPASETEKKYICREKEQDRQYRCKLCDPGQHRIPGEISKHIPNNEYHARREKCPG